MIRKLFTEDELILLEIAYTDIMEHIDCFEVDTSTVLDKLFNLVGVPQDDE
jgi:hypothetical protein